MNSIQKPAVKSLEVQKAFRVEVRIEPNPDYYQSFKTKKCVIEADSLKELQTLQRQFVDESHRGISSDMPIGGGNWGYNSMVKANGKIIGRMSYNGRIWDKSDNEVIAI